jgi:hypothetical protein
MNENSDKKEEVDEIVKSFLEDLKRKKADPKFWEKKKPKSIYDMPRKYKLSEEERKEVPEKYKQFIKIQEEAIRVVRKYLIKFKDSGKYLWVIKDLERGLNVLEVGYRKDVEKGPEGLLADLERFQKGRRPGFGLSRGFGEFLFEGGDWQEEIMDAVEKIEDYYCSM